MWLLSKLIKQFLKIVYVVKLAKKNWTRSGFYPVWYIENTFYTSSNNKKKIKSNETYTAKAEMTM